MNNKGQKRVSFKVAKALKEAGYPQEITKETVFHALFDPMYCVCPYAMDVWLWLWREKGIQIDVVSTFEKTCFIAIWKLGERIFSQCKNVDPEEAIIAAIEYLVDNDLIK